MSNNEVKPISKIIYGLLFNQIQNCLADQPGTQSEGTVIVPDPSGNADGEWAASLNPCANPFACVMVYLCCPCALMEIASYAGRNSCRHCCCAPCYVRKKGVPSQWSFSKGVT